MNVDEAMESAAAYLTHEQEGEPMFASEQVAIRLAAEVERLRAELAAAKAASVLPVEIESVFINKYIHAVVVFIGNEKGTLEFEAWLTKRQDKSPPQA
jgi:hypothetical protein